MNIEKDIKDQKQELLAYFRDRAMEFLTQSKLNLQTLNLTKEQEL